MFSGDMGGKVKTKVLAELMHHMMNLGGQKEHSGMGEGHGSPEMPGKVESISMIGMPGAKAPHMTGATSNAELPKANGTMKHEPRGKIEGVSVVSAKPMHESEKEPVDMNEHGGEGHEPEDHDLSDLFGRKKGRKFAF